MKDINCVVLSGRLTRDAKVQETEGFSVLTFSIAVNGLEKVGGSWIDVPSYFNCVIFVKTLGEVLNVLKKGNAITLSGRLRQKSWEFQGKTKHTVDVVVDSFRYYGRTSKEENSLKEDLLEMAKASEEEKGPEAFDEGVIPF